MKTEKSVYPFFTASVRAVNPYRHQTEIVSSNHFPTLKEAENFLEKRNFSQKELIEVNTAGNYAVIVKQLSPTSSRPEEFFQ